jgi:hypothetical protein
MRHPDLHIRRREARRHRHRRHQYRQQRQARIYHTGTNNNAHNTPLFEYMFDSLSYALALTKEPSPVSRSKKRGGLYAIGTALSCA